MYKSIPSIHQDRSHHSLFAAAALSLGALLALIPGIHHPHGQRQSATQSDVYTGIFRTKAGNNPSQVSEPTAPNLSSKKIPGISFAALSYKEPFPTTTPGQPNQGTAPIVYSNNFDSLPFTGGILNNCFNPKNGVLKLPTPEPINQGLPQITIEFWLKFSPNTKVDGMITSGPGFVVRGDFQTGGMPNGIITYSINANTESKFVQRYSGVIAAVGDGLWHQYVVTCDGHTMWSFLDGRMVNRKWFSNTPTQIGPYDSNQQLTPQLTVGGIINKLQPNNSNAMGAYLDEMRISSVALSPWQVRRNFESYRKYSLTYYASPSGIASNPGTVNRPFDLATALSKAGPNVKIILLAGTYPDPDLGKIKAFGASYINDCLITGADSSSPAILSSQTSQCLISSATFLTLRNLTFQSSSPYALIVRSNTGPVEIDSCRFTGSQNGLLIDQCSGQVGTRGQYTTGFQTGVSVYNCQTATSGTGMQISNSDHTYVLYNTLVGGSQGLQVDGTNSYLFLFNNIFSGQAGNCVNLGSTARTNYTGDGNVYDPASGGYVANFAGTKYTAAQFNDFIKAWYNFQFAKSLPHGNGLSIRVEQKSLQLHPTFSNAGSGDFRLTGISGNPIDEAADPSINITHDGLGNQRPLGSGSDPGAFECAAPLRASFPLTVDCTTSAGVYDSKGVLVRTLWRGRPTQAGTLQACWSGLDDLGKRAAAGTYTIRLLSHNLVYHWDGTVGNNSVPNTGSGVHANFWSIQSMTIKGSQAIYSPGYNESRSNLLAFDTTNPLQITGRLDNHAGIGPNYDQAVTADSTTIYAVDSSNMRALKLSDFSPIVSGGNPLQTPVGVLFYEQTYIAVQQNGSRIFVCKPNEGRIYVFDKTTFQPDTVPYMTINQPGAIATAPNGDLWVCMTNANKWDQVVRIHTLTTQPASVQTLTGFSQVMGLAVSPIDGTLLVADGGNTQQVKAFSDSGDPKWVLGQKGGYANGPAVTSTKFLLNGMLAWQPDGAFWVGDLSCGNRSLRFDASLNYIDQILYTPHSYCSGVDLNDPTRVFNQLTEYKIDYTQPLEEGAGWTPINYWGYMDGKFLGIDLASAYNGLKNVVTMSNGHTYAEITNNMTWSTFPKGTNSIVELTPAGLRSTGYLTPANLAQWINRDGSLTWGQASLNINSAAFNRKALLGFDSNNNPMYGPTQNFLNSPYHETWDSGDPITTSNLYLCAFDMTSDGNIVTFSPFMRGGFHLGKVSGTTGQYLWKTAPATGRLDGHGNFDTLAEYGGNRIMVLDDQIIFGYHGEFWNDGQANQYMHYSTDGLFLGQFGTGQGLSWGVETCAIGAAGNSFTPTLVKYGSQLYLYHNDESDHGVHRWSIDGLDTIKRQSGSVVIR